MPTTKKPQGTPIEVLALKYDLNKRNIKSLEDENKKLRVPLENYLKTNGVVPDEEAGHRVCVLKHADAEIVLKHTHKVSAVLQPDAIDILKKKGLNEAVETIEVVREDVISRLYDEGKITDAVMKRLYVSKESDAFSVSVKTTFKDSDI